jgi:hypothetical protein
MKSQVWIEGYAATGEHGGAQQLVTPDGKTEWEGETFKEVVKNALKELEWSMGYYDEEKNTYWGCRFFDNEIEARKSFG